MAYLTYSEYTGLGFSSINDEDSFNTIETTSESQFDMVTRGYYVTNDITTDTDTNRVALFKKALAMQCDFVSKTGIASTVDLVNNSVKTVSIGRTSVTKNIDYTSIVDSASGICYTAMNVLALTGLLFRGVDAVCHL